MSEDPQPDPEDLESIRLLGQLTAIKRSLEAIESGEIGGTNVPEQNKERTKEAVVTELDLDELLAEAERRGLEGELLDEIERLRA